MNTRKTRRTVALAIGGAVALLVAFAWAQNSADLLVIDQPIDHDAYVAQREVELRSPVSGDFVAAGRRLSVDGTVAGDVIAAAQIIEINSQVNDDLRLAGQHIRVSAPVSGHIVAVGQTVIIEQDVGDFAWLAGDTVEVLGTVSGNLSIRAENITVDAEVTGDIEMIGGHLDLGPKTVVRGNVRWRSNNEADISPDAKIEGELIEETPPGIVDELSDPDTYSLPLSLIVAVIVLFLLFSRPLQASSESLTARPGVSLLVGLVVSLIGLPLAIVLFITGVGVWLGFAVLLVYFAILLLGLLTGYFAVSNIALRRFCQQPALWQSVAAIFVTVVVIGLLAKIPTIGFITVIAVLLIGVGTLCWHSWTMLRAVRRDDLQPS